MEEYIVSARKYRPMTFDSVVGQQALTTTLKNAIKTGRLAHAYLFCGPRGVGKTTCARIFAKTINCQNPGTDGECCGECESCRSFNENRSLNIHELDAASNNSVDDIRELIKQVQIPPQTGRYKVFIIDEVHMLSQQAFNAFLKTLEEPPHYVIFIMATTEKHKILPTILSRCQVYDFQRMGLQDIVNHLGAVAKKEGFTIEGEALQLIAEKADGGMRDALSIFDQMVSFTHGSLTYEGVCKNLNVLSTEYYFKLVDYFLCNDVEPCMLLLNEILCKGFDAGNFIAGLASHMRQLLVARDTSTLPLLETSERLRKRYQEQAQKCNFKFIYRVIRLANDCDQAYRQSHNKRLQVEICLIQCAQATIEPAEDKPGAAWNARVLKKIFEVQQVQKVDVIQKEESIQKVEKVEKTDKVINVESVPINPKRKTFNIGNIGPSIRLNNVLIKTEDFSAKPEGKSLREKPVAIENLILEWNRMVQHMPQEHRAMAMRMQTMYPKLISETTFEVIAGNSQVLQYMMNLKKDILTQLKNALENDHLDMQVKIAKTEEVKALLSKPALYEKMCQRNPNIKKIFELLELEII